jgi:hypothetical protein
MSESTTAMTLSASVYTTRGFWEHLWRTAGLQFVAFFVVAYFIYGNQPQVGASAGLISNAGFVAGVATLLLVLLGGTTWLSGGL